MCGRYQLLCPDVQNGEMARMWNALEQMEGESFLDSFSGEEIRPGDRAPVITARGPALINWGFPNPAGKGLIINARSESAKERPMFREAVYAARLLVPTTGFYEWRHAGGGAKDKFHFQLPGQDMLYLAGLYALFPTPEGERQPRFVILTAKANPSMTPFHNRMPVIIPHKDRQLWLTDTQYAHGLLKRPQPELCPRQISPTAQLSMF